MTMLAIFMPVAMIWVAATAARASRVMREESHRLQAAIDAIRQAYIAQSRDRDLSREPSVSRKLDEIAAAARKTETTLTTFTKRHENVNEPNAPQPALRLRLMTNLFSRWAQRQKTSTHHWQQKTLSGQ